VTASTLPTATDLVAVERQLGRTPRGVLGIAHRCDCGEPDVVETSRLATDPALAASYAAAHRDYLARRDAIEVLPGSPGSGGMPDRVKCLHALVAHALAAGPGVNPLGDEALAMLPSLRWGGAGPCVEVA
jgi:hypothetical protein